MVPPTATTRPDVPRPRVLSARTLAGDDVVDPRGDKLGTLEALMIDLEHGRVAYAVLRVGGFLGLGCKRFAIPWSALTVDTRARHVVLPVPRAELEKASGFDPGDWPDEADGRWIAERARHEPADRPAGSWID